MKKVYDSLFNFFTRSMSYGIAVVLFSVLWAGLFTQLNLMYLVPMMSRFFDFNSQWFLLLKVLFLLPYPTAMVLYGAFTRLGIPAALPGFRLANRHINVENGSLAITEGLTGEEYRALLKAINRMPVIFLIVAIIELGYIDIIVLVAAFYQGFSIQTICWILFSWVMQTINYGCVGYILAETVTGRMRRECKMKLRELHIEHETASRSSIIFKMAIIGSMVLITITITAAMTYLQRGEFGRVLAYVITYTGVIAVLSYLTMRVFYRALHDTSKVVEQLKDRGEGIIFASTLDREIVTLATGINAASDTINDYRLNLENKVEERTRELTEANDELEAAMEELAATNESLVRVNRELEDSNVRFRKDMQMAASVQAAFLPRTAPNSDGYDIAYVFKPMSGVSGDFYDFYHIDGRLDGAGIFDVSGHGISSGLLTLLARSIIGKHFMNNRDEKLGTMMNSINKALINELGETGYYLTGILLRFRESMIEYANSGHPHLLFRSGRTGNVGQVTPPDGESIVGPFLGVDILDKNYRSLSFKFNPGDCLVAYTDSLAETTCPDGRPYEEARIMKSLREAPESRSQEILDHVMKSFYDHAQKDTDFSDDITAIVIRKK